MSKQKFVLSGFCSMVGLFAYVTLVGFIMSRFDKLPDQAPGLLLPTTILMLFVFSALVSSSIVLGYPGWLYFEGRKKESLFAFVSVALWIFLALVILLGWRLIAR